MTREEEEEELAQELVLLPKERAQLLRLNLGAIKEELVLLALCHLFDRQTTRKSDILYTYSVVVLRLAFSF